MSIRGTVGAGIWTLTGMGITILGLVIHVWTIVIAFTISGLFAAVFTLVFPVLSELYWFVKVWSNVGLDSTYCMAILAYVGLFIVAILGAWLVSSDS